MPTALFGVELGAPEAAGTQWVLRRGKIFEAGDYPDKKFSLSPAEMQAAAASFAPVKANLNHKKTLLDGKLGGLVTVECGEDGKTLFGVVAEPRWLSDVLSSDTGPTKGHPVSLEWDTETKSIIGIAHTGTPRITDAAVFDAYAQFSMGDEVQFAYESDAERNAVDSADFADPDSKLFPIRTQAELRDAQRQVWNAADPLKVMTNIQKIAARKGLDVAKMDWPLRATPGVAANLNSGMVSYYSGDGKEQVDMDQNTQAAVAAAEKSAWDKFKAFFGITSEQAAQFEQSAGKTPRELQLEADLNRERKANFDRDAAGRTATAKQKAEALLKAGRFQPAALEAVVAEFSRALDDDAATPKTVTFSMEENGAAKQVAFSRADRLEWLYGQVPPAGDTEEAVRDFAPETYAAFAQEATKLRNPNSEAVDEAMVTRGLSQTAAGRKALEREKAAAGK